MTKKRPPNFRGFFLIGLSLIVLGTAFIIIRPQAIGPVFIAVGGLFILFGLDQKNKLKN